MRSIRGDARRTGSDGDAELVRAARGGSAHAREALFHRTVHLVYGLSFRLCGKLADHRMILGEIFHELFASLDGPERPQPLRPWVAGLVARSARRAIRPWRLRARLGLPMPPAPHFDAALQDAPSAVAAELDRLYDAVERLPMNQRMAFLLHRVEGMSLAEVSVALDASLPQIRRWVARADARLGVRPPAPPNTTP